MSGEEEEEKRLEYAFLQLKEVLKRLETIKSRIDDGGGPNPQAQGILIEGANVISDCQACIELSVKAMYASMNIKPPRGHSYGQKDIEKIVNKSGFPEKFDQKEQIPQVVFRLNVWEPFYEEARYGYPEINITAGQITQFHDGARALVDAAFCVVIVAELIHRRAEDLNYEYYEDGETKKVFNRALEIESDVNEPNIWYEKSDDSGNDTSE